MTAVLPRSDFLRAPLLATADPTGSRSGTTSSSQHGLSLINFSLADEALPGRHILVPRVIVIAHDHRWRGALERFDPAALDVSADLGALTVGANRLVVLPDGYRVEIDLPDRGIRGEFVLTHRVRRPFVVNNQPVGEGRMNWLFVPRLRADGWLRIGGRAATGLIRNWPITTTTGATSGGATTSDGRGAPSCPGTRDPWSMVFLQMTDRRRLRTFRTSPLRVAPRRAGRGVPGRGRAYHDSPGLLGRPAELTLPPPMRLLLGEASDVPASLTVTGDRPGHPGAPGLPTGILRSYRAAE